MKKVLFVASEGLPFIKSGGLADVIGSLPQAISETGCEVRVVLPLYLAIERKFTGLKEAAEFDVQSGIIFKRAVAYSYETNGLTYYFIRCDEYFQREQLYSYQDDGERFAFFDKAVLEMLKYIDFKPDIIHCNDWQTGMIPVLCKMDSREDFYRRIRTVFTIHNLAYQGNFPKEILSCFNLDYSLFSNGSLRFDGGISYLKAALVYADKITTVSGNYAREILTPEFGEKMDDILRYRSKDLVGIVNGIDDVLWNPETDQHIAANFSRKGQKGKMECKLAIQRELGLRESRETFLIAVVSRLAVQKGLNLVIDKMQEIMNRDVQLIILGSGDKGMENYLAQIEHRFPHRAVCYRGYNEELAHRIYAGADAFLMPSLFEPCGISQLIAMRYGTLPIVRETGGLKDTVDPYNEYEKTGTGFTFRHFSSDDMMYVITMAIETFYMRKDDWKIMVKNAMSQKFDWKLSSEKYVELYNSI